MIWPIGGGAICRFGLATNRKWHNKQTGEMQEDTCFVDIVVFGRQAETCNEYLSKGRPVFVEGRLSFSSWEDRESGQRRSKLEVVAERVQFLGSRGEGGGGGGSGGGGESAARRSENDGSGQHAPAAEPAAVSRAAPAQPASAPTQSPGIDFDDIPF